MHPKTKSVTFRGVSKPCFVASARAAYLEIVRGASLERLSGGEGGSTCSKEKSVLEHIGRGWIKVDGCVCD